MENVQNEFAARYLLGKMSDEEAASVEKEYFQDAASFENVLIAEYGLIDAYVSDRLSADDRSRFEKRLLITEHQRQRVAIAETLVNYASRQLVDDTISQTSFFTRLVSLRPLFSFSLAAAALLFFAVGIFWLRSGALDSPGRGDVALNPEQVDSGFPMTSSIDQAPVANVDRAPSPVAETGNAEIPLKKDERLATPKSAKPIAPPVLVSTIILSLGSTRDVEGREAFVIPRKTDLVNLKLNFEGGSFSSYFAVIETADGQHMWSGKAAGSRSNNAGAAASLRVPAARLGRGDYVVSLKGLTKAGVYEPVADYSFTVDRR